ncbi:MAG TPA: 2Fe-2S iron-sulfur cluster-binding protein [Burkholderiaceae bacterium]|nr:2Fe-2S iron-sulfur cluster-binding protein [Burkholderiaceae bacterium]
MSHSLNLARAAQLLGLPRSTLQRMIRNGELRSDEGFITIDELKRAFPQATLEDAGAFASVARIRDEAFGRRVRERLLPSQEVLAQRVLAQSQELADLRRCTQAYHALVTALLELLRDPARTDPGYAVLAERIEVGLKEILGAAPAGQLDAMADMLRVVAAQVTLRPSGRTFLVEGNDSILQAGLKSGARFAYGCGSGTCGLCKARVVSGETRQIAAADYPLSAQERAQGYCLLCAHTAVTDVTIETLEARGPQDVPAQEIEAKVRAVTPLAADTRLLHLQTPRSGRLRFLAGQAVTLGMTIDGADATATLPLASCPCDERNLQFHVARSDDAALAQALFADRVHVGDTIVVRGPVGDFVLGAAPAGPLLMLACDTGFAPIKSVIEHALAGEEVEAIELHWLATRADGHYLANQCRSWAAAFDQFRYHPATAADAAHGARSLVAQIAAAGGWRQSESFIAGGHEFVDAVVAGLRGAGADASNLHVFVL